MKFTDFMAQSGNGQQAPQGRKFADHMQSAEPLQAPDNPTFSQPLSEFGTPDHRPVEFGTNVRGGVERFQASALFGRAMVEDLLDIDNSDTLRQAQYRAARSAEINAGGPSFQDVLDDPTGEFGDWAVSTLGELTPDIIAGIASTAAGALVGSVAGPAGTAAGGLQGFAARTAIQSALRKETREALERVAKGVGTAADRRVATQAFKVNAAQRYATIGAAAGNAPQAYGEAYQESIDAGDPSPWGSLLVGTGSMALDTLPQMQAIRLLGDVAKGTPGGLASEALKAFGTATVGEAGTELGQEELLIRFRDSLVPEDYASTDEANSRRLEAGAAGALAGGARAGAIDVPALAAGEVARRLPNPGQSGGAPSGATGNPQGSPQGGPQDGLRRRFSDFMSQFDPPTDRDGVVITPEPQQDIDAQYEAMMDPANPKQGIEITDGSPMPTGLDPNLHQVRTPNGVFITPDPQVAARVEQAGGSDSIMAEVLGYGQAKQDVPPEYAESVIVTDDQGRVIHNEVVDRRERQSIRERLREYGRNIKFQPIQQTVAERMPPEARANFEREMQGIREGTQRVGEAARQGADTVRQGAEATRDFAQREASNIRQDARRAGAAARQTTAGVQAMMTNAMRATLAGLGYTADQIRKMRPQQAADIIDEAQADPSQPPPSPEEVYAAAHRAARRQLFEQGLTLDQVRDLTPEQVFEQAGVEPPPMPDPAVDPAPGQQFTPEPEVNADPAPGQQFDESVEPEPTPTAEEAQKSAHRTARRRLFEMGYTLDQIRDLTPQQVISLANGESLDDVRDMKMTDFERQQFNRQDDFVDPEDAAEAEADRQAEAISRGVDEQLMESLGVERDENGRYVVEEMIDADAADRTLTAEEPDERFQTRVDDMPSTSAQGTPLNARERGIGRRIAPAQLREEKVARKGAQGRRPDFAARRAETQNLEWQVLGPNTKRTVVTNARGDQFEVPTTVYKKLQRYREEFPEDDWSLAMRKTPNDETRTEVGIVRHRDPTRHERDSAYFTPDGTAVGTTQHIMSALDRAIYRGQGMPANRERYSLTMEDGDGNIIYVNPVPLAWAGADVNHGMGGRNSQHRAQMGLATALAVLDDLGFKPKSMAKDVAERSLPRSTYSPRIVTVRPLPESGVEFAQGETQWVAEFLRTRGMDSRKGKRLHNRAATMLRTRFRPRYDGLTPQGDLPSEVTDSLQLVFDNNPMPSRNAEMMWEAMTVAERDSVVAEYAENPAAENSDTPLGEQDPAVIEALNDRDKTDWFFDERPELEQQADVEAEIAPETTASDTATREQLHETIPEVAGGVRVDPNLPSWVSDVVTTAREVSQLQGDMIVVQSGVDLAKVAASLSATTRNKLSGRQRTQLAHMLQGRSGATGSTMRVGDTTFIVIREGLSPEASLFTLAHELGHATYNQHFTDLMSDQKRFNKLYEAFTKDREQGQVMQYDGDERLAFEEWMADRYGSWLNRRTRSGAAAVAKQGAFTELRSKMRKLFDAVAKKAREVFGIRFAANRTADQFFDQAAQVAALQRRVRELERGVNGRDRYNQDKYAEYLMATKDLERAYQRMNGASEPATIADLEAAMEEAHLALSRRDARTAAREAQAEQAERRAAAEAVRQFAEAARQRQQEETQQPYVEGQRAAEYIQQMAERIRQGDRMGGTPPPSDGGALTPSAEPPYNVTERGFHNTFRDYASSRAGEGIINDVRRKIPEFLRVGVDALDDVLSTTDARMRRLSPELAQMLWSGPNTRSRAGQRGYHNAVQSELAHWANKMDEALPDDKIARDRVLAAIQSEMPRDQLPPEAHAMHDFMQELGGYLEQNVHGFTARENYGTRVYNQDEINARPAQFEQFLVDNIPGMTLGEAGAIRRTITMEDGAVALETEDQAGAGPGLAAAHARVLNELPNALLQQYGFLETPERAIAQHLRAAVHRAEFERVFGAPRPLDQILADMEMRQARGQNVPQSAIDSVRREVASALEAGVEMPTRYDPAGRAKDAIGRIDGAQQRQEAFDMFEANMGRSNRLFGHQIGPKTAQVQAAVTTYTYMTTLGMAAISQITDFATIAMRMRSLSAASDMIKILGTMSASERREFAKRVGTVQEQATLDAIHSTYGGDYMTPTTRWLSDTFFKLTGLQAVTDYNRAVATQMGMGFIARAARQANEGDPTGLRQLADLGLQPEDVATFYSEGQNWDTEAGTKVRQALFDFVDESILRPNASMRPEWASNPWFQMLWVLKPFIWGGKKIFIDGAYREYVAQRREGKSIAQSAAPLAMVALMGMPLAMASVAIRDMAKDALNSVADDDDYQWMLTSTDWASWDGAVELLDRTGVMGPASLVWGMYSGTEFGTPPAISAGGPVTERLYRLSQGEVDRVAGDSVPFLGLVY